MLRDLDGFLALLVFLGVRLRRPSWPSRSRPRSGRCEPVMVIFCSLPVPRSLALTCRMPLASMSKVTSICGTPRGAGGMSVEMERAEDLVVAGHRAFALQHVDFHRRLVVASGGEDLLTSWSGWSCCARSSAVNTPPTVSMPSDSGVTSSRSTSFTSPFSTPPWMAAPIATTSSGFTPLCGSLPTSSRAVSTTLGMRVMPPTSTSSSISAGADFGVLQAVLDRADRALEQVVAQLLQLGAGQLLLMCFGPVWSAVMNGRLIS